MNNIDIPECFTKVFEGCSGWNTHGSVFKKVIDIVKPNNMAEFGFFTGGSAYMWLYLSNAKVTSVDPFYDCEQPQNPRKYDGKPENVSKLRELFPNRFTFYQMDSRFVYPYIKDEKYDLIFIDSSHLAPFVRCDLNTALKLKIPYILLDDYNGEVEAVYKNEFENVHFETIEIFDTSMLDTGVMNRACFAKLKV